MSEVKDTKSDKLSASDRTAFKSFVTQRRDALLKTILDEMGDGRSDDQLQLARIRAGIIETPDQISEQIVDLENELDGNVRSHLERANTELAIARAEKKDEFDERLRALRDKYNKDRADIEEASRKAMAEFDGQESSIEDSIRKEHYPEKMSKIEELRLKLASVKKVDAEIRQQLRNRALLVRNCRSRVESGVREACNNAIEQLWTIESREEANRVLQSIPKVNEIIESLGSVDGINAVLQRLSPALALPAPSMQSSPSVAVVNGVQQHGHNGPTIDVPLKQAEVANG